MLPVWRHAQRQNQRCSSTRGLNARQTRFDDAPRKRAMLRNNRKSPLVMPVKFEKR